MKQRKLLDRDSFRNAVFERDQYKCVFCHKSAEQTPEGKLDAHHILERRLFNSPEDFGGYFLDNGATVCEEHHRQCEMTTISCEEVRDACGIIETVIPSYFYADERFDKWGNNILPSGERLKGELFYDESVQKILAKGGVLGLFSDRVKYPRTNHVPWSQSVQKDDRVHYDMSQFHGRHVIVTEKMDGENSSIYRDYIHARSVSASNHPSRNLLRAFAARFQHDIPEGWRICGENVFAKHSIHYDDLPHHFMGFSVWNEKNECLSWSETMEIFDILGIVPVPILYEGIYDEAIIKGLWTENMRDRVEGYVMRVADGFAYRDFKTLAGKFVRANHVAATVHNWKSQPVVPNGFKEKF